MKLYSYLALDNNGQWNQLWDLGTYITHIEEDKHKYVLYGLGDFYVEVKYNKMDNNIISKKQFRQGPVLQKYLDLIHIDG